MGKKLQLTEAATGNKFNVDEAEIIKVATDTLGALVQYIRQRDGQRYNAVVTESPADIAYVSETLITVTDANTAQAYWVSIDRIGLIDGTGTNVLFLYNIEGASPEPIQITGTLETFLTLVYEKQGDLVYSFDDVAPSIETISLAAAEGDVSAKFTNGVVFEVFGSSTAAMNTLWTVSSSTYAGSKTVITVDSPLPEGATETGSVRLHQ